MVFKMLVEAQYNIGNTTLIAGVPEKDEILPKKLKCDLGEYKVTGFVLGVVPPKLGLQLERTNDDLIGQVLKA